MIKLKDILSEQSVNMVDGTKLRVSQRFWDDLKREEGLTGTNGAPALKAYKLGDGRITIGWGHTGSMSGPKPKLGDEIDQATAQKYLQADAKESADCVRRLLTEWKQQGIRAYEVTQSMFDALVSIVFNAGCNGMRSSKFIQLVKTRDWNEAAEMLPSDSSMIRGKFTKGLVARREREASRFLEDGVPLNKYFGKGERMLNLRSSKR